MNTVGAMGEEMARKYMEEKGYHFLEKNFHSPWGEIDLIMQNKEYLVFVEVKTRADDTFAHPFEAVHIPKQNRLIQTAFYYLSLHHSTKMKRFDVVGITLDTGKIEHVENAFPCGLR